MLENILDGDNELMNLLNSVDEGEVPMFTEKVKDLYNEIELYKQAIQDAKEALASAEQELDETLDAEYNR